MTVRVRMRADRGERHLQVDIRFRWPDGTEYRERTKAPVTGKSAAKRWGEEREAELLRRGKPIAPTPEKSVPTLAEFAPRFVRDYAVADGHGEGGVESKESILRIHLVPHIGNRRLDEITTADVQKLKGIWREGVIDKDTGKQFIKPTRKIKTLNNRLTVLGKLLKVAVEWHVLGHMPCEVRLLRGDDSQVMGFYEFAVYDQLVEAAERCGRDVYLAVLLGGDAGLRRGEIIGLQQGDIVQGKLHVQRQVYFAKTKDKREPVVRATKGKSKRWVPLTPRLAAALAEHRHLRGPWVLSDEQGRHLTPKLLRLLVQRAERRAGTEPLGRLHVLRHTFCSHLAMAGATPITIQELAGHESLETTMGYMHLSPSAADGAVALLDRARRAGGAPGTAPILGTRLAPNGGSRPS
jgi:integrase